MSSTSEAQYGGPSRRELMKAILAGSAAGLSGCLFTARTELPSSPVLWPPFRFAHVSGLRLSFGGDWEARHWAVRAADAVRDERDLDFLLLGGDLVEGADPFDFVLLEEFVAAAGLHAFSVPGAKDRPSLDGYGTRMEAMGLTAWNAPWEASPVDGVRLVGLDSGPPEKSRARVEEQIPFLTAVLDRSSGDAVIVVLSGAPRLDGRSTVPGTKPVDSEILRFVLEAAPEVKMVLSGAAAPFFVRNEAGLLYVNTPPVSSFPFGLRIVTVRGSGAVMRNRLLADEQEREAHGRKLAASTQARSFNPAFPEAYFKSLEGEEGREVYALR
jgi:hypothetical protein